MPHQSFAGAYMEMSTHSGQLLLAGNCASRNLAIAWISPSLPVLSILRLDFKLFVCLLRFSKNVSSNIFEVVWNSDSESIGGRPDSMHKVKESDSNI